MDNCKLASKYNLLGDKSQIYRLGRTDYLVTRELPNILAKYKVNKILDLGCGAGLSTRFIKKLGYECIGTDINDEMLSFAKKNDPSGIYIKTLNGNSLPFEKEVFDMVVSVFVLFEIPTIDLMIKFFNETSRVLKKGCTFIAVTGSEELYKRKWLSLDLDFHENKNLRSGDICRIKLKYVDLILEDYFWTNADYAYVAKSTGFNIHNKSLPLGKTTDGVNWQDEINYPPFVFYEFEKII